MRRREGRWRRGGAVQTGTYELVSGPVVVLPKAADQLHTGNTGGIFGSMISKCCFGLVDDRKGLPQKAQLYY